MLGWLRSGHWSCRCGWGSRPVKPSCVGRTTSVPPACAAGARALVHRAAPQAWPARRARDAGASRERRCRRDPDTEAFAIDVAARPGPIV